jgi:4-hydroxy-4-methyl-2-oxoglutarate aldolase
MIGDPVALTIRRKIERPAKSIMKAFAGMPTGFVTDAYNGKGCLDYAIKPLFPTMSFSGSAITAFCGPMDNLAAMAILDFAQKGDVIVIATTGDDTAATIGDLWAFWAKKIGVAAIICDGLVRDVTGLLKVDIPVYTRGIKPNSAFKNGPGEINTTISCGGVSISAGDIMVGDRDGVVAIPLAEAASVVERLELVKKKEAEAEAKVKKGIKLKFWDPDTLGNRVHYID